MGSASIGYQSNVPEFMSIFRVVLDKWFVQKNYKVNAQIVINKLKERKIDVEGVKNLFKKLPKGQWSIKVFMDNIESINAIFGISDKFIQEHSVENLDQTDLIKVRWEVLLQSMLEYSQFAAEFYDALKYNKSGGLSIAKINLLNELMMTFKYMKKSSKEIYDKFQNKNYSGRALEQFNIARLPLEFLILRFLYIILNLQDAKDKKINYYAEILGIERISLTYQKIIKIKYN